MFSLLPSGADDCEAVLQASSRHNCAMKHKLSADIVALTRHRPSQDGYVDAVDFFLSRWQQPAPSAGARAPSPPPHNALHAAADALQITDRHAKPRAAMQRSCAKARAVAIKRQRLQRRQTEMSKIISGFKPWSRLHSAIIITMPTAALESAADKNSLARRRKPVQQAPPGENGRIKVDAGPMRWCQQAAVRLTEPASASASAARVKLDIIRHTAHVTFMMLLSLSSRRSLS
jgi:hypothetical protein